jgi:hypothetical protein
MALSLSPVAMPSKLVNVELWQLVAWLRRVPGKVGCCRRLHMLHDRKQQDRRSKVL